MRVTTAAIVLRTVDYGEADRVVTLFTRDHGKLSALARGARKSVKRFGAALGLFGVGEAVLVDKPNVELATLERFDGARGFPALRLLRRLRPSQRHRWTWQLAEFRTRRFG